ncbi:MAG: MBL fold metallo-hydrolase, partial [Planctomycetes bacterium]|nr:MBL fold metallo-hydrolase [Planctomycetota bacterium]
IESQGLRILFDTGQGRTLIDNAQNLDKDLAYLSHVILSHGHYDHAGGIELLINNKKDFIVIAHPDIFQKKYGKLPNEESRYIGISVEKETLEKKTRLNLSREPFVINEYIRTTGEIPMQTKYEKIDASLFVRQGNKNIPDEVPDDLALILETEKGIVVVLGCSHRGLINTLYQVTELIGHKNIYAIIGGLHLERASSARITRTIKSLNDFNLQKIGVSHCTGFRAAVKLYNAFGEKVFVNRVGHVLEV